jgi:anti-sigma-K factor RskA
VALAAGLLAGSAIGRNSTPPAPPQVVHFSLQGHGSLSGVTATVTDIKSDGIALVSFTGLPAPPDGKVYELWLITPSNQADASGVFLPDSNGQRVLVIERPLSGFKVMAVTVETGPDGVQSPTQQPQIYGAIA